MIDRQTAKETKPVIAPLQSNK